MTFTFDGYRSLLRLLSGHGYETASYHGWREKRRCVILRHDIDADLSQAVRFAQLEREEGVASTYFVLLTSDFYNVFSKANRDKLLQIVGCGHEIGLHFDEAAYPELTGDPDAIREKILEERDALQAAIRGGISLVSMHRPSRAILDADLDIPGMINSYGKTFFWDFKYLSDSRRRWREPAEQIVASEQYERLHILTHAFWYHEKEEAIRDSVGGFICRANRERYQQMQDNITDLESILPEAEI